MQIKRLEQMFEGGNVFKDAKGQPVTKRINQSDIPATVQWLEQLTGIDLTTDIDPRTGKPSRWLGSTGKNPTSGDLDLAVDTADISKQQLADRLTKWAVSHNLNPKDWVVAKGEVHFKTPINGRVENGFVQTDFMFFDHLDWGTFYYSQGPGSAYKGMNRAVLLSSIAKHYGLKVGSNGVISRETNKVVSQDPDQLAQWIIGPRATRENLDTVEAIYTALAKNKDRDALLKDFREYLAREGLKEPGAVEESVDVGDVSIMARLRDRIVNQGMSIIIESEDVGNVGGAAKGIEHLEDLVFRKGARGIQEAIEILRHASEDTTSTTVKWDGSPALMFGRKPATGEFVLTDIAGFEAKGYDGLATSYDMMVRIQSQRSGDRTDLLAKYKILFQVLEAATPANFRGYIKGDLLYTARPPIEDNRFVFQPNTVNYRIPVNSALGQRIAKSQVGIGMHSIYADRGAVRQAVTKEQLSAFNPVKGLLLIEPIFGGKTVLNQKLVAQLNAIDGSSINNLFNPAKLRELQIVDFAKLCVDYVNYRVKRTGNYDQMLKNFGPWLKEKVNPRKFNNLVKWIQTDNNVNGITEAFTAFKLLHSLKSDVLGQLDKQHPGQEGWVMTTPTGTAKAVNRFDFSANNDRQNNNSTQ